MLKYQGKGVYGAVAVGKISVFKRQDVQVRREKTEDTASELKRLEDAKTAAIAQLQEIYEKALREVGEANAAIFEIHMMMVEDEDYNDAITEMITTQNVNAEYAVAITGDNFAEMFAAMDDAYMQARSADVRDISNRIIGCLTNGGSTETQSDEPVIICADDLAPSETVTLDGRKINIYANIGSVDNIGAVLLNDAGGIGLFRSEFLYLENTDYPSEDEQFRIYKRVLESMAGKKVIIRTLDIGADKQCDYFHMPKEENPALGIRAIRLCLNRQEVFRTQLRALFRASVFGNLGIMFPMIANVWELEEILALCDEVKAELRKESIEYSEDTELGIMIETPAAALISDQLAPMVDFFSVGTNDLTQYTLACDRQNPAIDRFCDVHHEAILRLIEMAAENAHKHGKWIGICGELAADTSLTETFLRMGIDELSVSPAFVLKVRDTVRSINLCSGN